MFQCRSVAMYSSNGMSSPAILKPINITEAAKICAVDARTNKMPPAMIAGVAKVLRMAISMMDPAQLKISFFVVQHDHVETVECRQHLAEPVRFCPYKYKRCHRP